MSVIFALSSIIPRMTCSITSSLNMNPMAQKITIHVVVTYVGKHFLDPLMLKDILKEIMKERRIISVTSVARHSLTPQSLRSTLMVFITSVGVRAAGVSCCSTLQSLRRWMMMRDGRTRPITRSPPLRDFSVELTVVRCGEKSQCEDTRQTSLSSATTVNTY